MSLREGDGVEKRKVIMSPSNYRNKSIIHMDSFISIITITVAKTMMVMICSLHNVLHDTPLHPSKQILTPRKILQIVI